MRRKIPRIVLTAPSSGSGKTVITCALLYACLERGIKPCALKCGPDYIDPMFHRFVLGVAGGNLDSFFLEKRMIPGLLGALAKDSGMAVIEGVMGYYDGVAGCTTQASTYEIARLTKSPALLIVDCKRASVSLAATVEGFLKYKEDSRIAGVILNRMNPGMYERLAPLIEGIGVPVLGYVPEREAFHLESRHLGLKLPGEQERLREQMGEAARLLEKTVDVERIIQLAERAEDLELGEEAKGFPEGKNINFAGASLGMKIGVAMDRAFCFYYQENLRALEECGLETVFFSPLDDEGLPKGISGLIFGGGYPELYGKELAGNLKMKRAVKEAAQSGMPILAECGGFLYLHRELEGADGRWYQMAGVVDARAFRTDRLSRFGYISLEAAAASGFLEEGETIKGHEFHYWDSDRPGQAWMARKPMSQKNWGCMVEEAGLLAGFPHLYYPSNLQVVRRLALRCLEYKNNRPVGE